MLSQLKSYFACLYCGHSRSFPLCYNCQKHISWTPEPHHPIHLDHKHHASSILLISPCHYHGFIRDLLQKYKYQHQLYWVHLFTDLVCKVLRQSTLSMPELLIPVPLHTKRFQTRGFNQAAILANHLSKRLEIPSKMILKRVQNTPPLHAYGLAMRLQLLSEAFAYAAPLKGMLHVALVDDIYTSGATLKACTKTLHMHHPDLKVTWITIAKTRIQPE